MTDKLDNPLKESLSALVDGEASELELRRILKSGVDSEARSVWQRYQLARAFLRGECNSPKEAQAACSFSASVLSAIEAEERGESVFPDENMASARAQQESGFGRTSIIRNQWFEGFGKVAIAASVAFAMLLGVNQFSLNKIQNLEGAVGLAAVEKHPGDTSAVVPEGYGVPSLNAMTVSSVAGGSPVSYRSPVRSLSLPAASNSDTLEYSPELQAQLQRMLILHSEKATDEVGLTIVPISRLSSQGIPKE